MRNLQNLLFCLALLVVFTQPVEAAEGRITDKKTGAPIAGAEVTVVGLPGSVKTDKDGRFSLKPDPRPPFVVIIVLPGGRVAKPIEVTEISGVLNLVVESAVSEEVTVAAGVAPSIEATLGAAMTMVTRTDIDQRSPANLMQAVENVPGVNQVSEGQASVPAVRGLARGRTLLLVDGSRVTSERRVGPSATFMDPSVMEGVDIARGPGSVAYGSDAFGGVISVRTRQPASQGWFGDGSFTYGSGVPDRRGEFTISKAFGTWGLLGSAHTRTAEDYDGPDVEVVNSGWADHGGLVRVKKGAGGGIFIASWQGDFGRDVERPRDNSNQVRFYYPFENSHRFNGSYEKTTAGTFDLVRVSAFYGTIEQRTDQDRIPTATRPRDIVRADISASDYQVRASASKLLGVSRLEFGMDLNGRTGLEAHDVLVQYDLAGNVVSNTDNLSIDNARRHDTAGFVEIDLTPASKVTVSGGLRGDYVSNVNEGGYFGDREVTNGAFSGYAAIAYGPAANFTFTAQVSRGFRDPTLSDRFFRGPNGRGFITGNPDLEPETSLQSDFGVRYAKGRVSAAAYTYFYRINNLIERYSPATDFFEFRNRGRAGIKGFETELQAELGHGLKMELGAQVGRGELQDDDTNLDDIATDQLSVILRQAFSSQLSAFFRVAFLAEDDRPGPSEIVAPGHTNLDLGATWAPIKHIEIRGAIRNLLDEEYYASPDPRFVLAPGINGFVTIRVKF